jgi:micrococcal nuclease
MAIHRFGAAIAALLALALPAARQPATARPGDAYAVRYVLDGDTLEIGGVGRVRLLGVDAPELGSALATPAPFAREARDRLAALAVGRWVRLERDGDERDAYRRTLAYVVRTDGLFINAELVRAGLARVNTRRALRRLGELRRAEEYAQQARRGIWGERPSIPGRTYRVPRVSYSTRPSRSASTLMIFSP